MKDELENDSAALSPADEAVGERFGAPVPETVDLAAEALDGEVNPDGDAHPEPPGETVPVIWLDGPGESVLDFELMQGLVPVGCELLWMDWPDEVFADAGVREAEKRSAEECAVEALADFLGRHALQKPILLGHKWGAAVAIEFAMRFPEQAEGLILCRPFGLLDAMPLSGLKRGLLKILGRNSSAGGQKAERWIKEKKELRERLSTALRQVPCPVLVALSRSNRSYPLQRLQELLAELDGGSGRLRLAVFAGSRSPLEDDPERMARVIGGFAAATQKLEKHRHAWTLGQVDWPSKGMNQWRCTHPECRAEIALPIGESPAQRG